MNENNSRGDAARINAAPIDYSLEEPRELDLESLKALAHPLRVQIFDALSIYGSSTASGLAERLGESSGATSYHLRQLEKHGFVREVEGKGSGRERWWERRPGSFRIGGDTTSQTPAGRSAASQLYRQIRRREEQLLDDFNDRSDEELSKEWLAASSISTMNTRLTVAQLNEMTHDVLKLLDGYVRANRDSKIPGARAVHLNFNAFPVIDGHINPDPDRSVTP